MQYVPLIGVGALIAIGVFWRSWLQRRRYGSSGIVLFRSRDFGQNVRDGLLVLVVVLVLGQAVAFAARPQSIAGGILMPPRNGPGVAALFGGVVLIVRAQLDLGASWRVGIDESAKPWLVKHGLYAFSRNPIYVGMLTALMGFALLVPTPISFVALVGSTIGIRRQVLGEEAYLRRVYGDDYLAYAGRVGRFLPWIGRLH